MRDINLSNIYATLASKETGPQVEIQATHKLPGNMYKIIAATYNVDNEAALTEAIAHLTEGKGRLVAGTFVKKDRMVSGVVAANTQSRPLDASFTMVTASTAADASGNIWSVVNDGGAKRVVLESSDDLADIFANRIANRKVYANPVEGRGLSVASISNGDLIRYIDNASTTWGFAFSTEAGLTAVGSDLVPRIIDADLIIANVPRTQLPKNVQDTVKPIEANAKLSPDRLNKIMNYLKEAYPKGPMSNEILERYRKLAGAAK